jgi:hypothetical protein
VEATSGAVSTGVESVLVFAFPHLLKVNRIQLRQKRSSSASEGLMVQ